MFFDKPMVLPSEVPEIASLFSESKVRSSRYLGGVPNVTWSIDLGNEAIAIRVCNRGYTSEEHLSAELSVLAYLESVGYEYSPRLVRERAGSYTARWRGYPVIATSLIVGESGESVPLTLDVCYEAGQALGNLRSVLEGCTVRLPESDRFDLRGNRLIRMLPKTAHAYTWPINIEAITVQSSESLSQIWRFCSQTQMRLVHTDVWPPNTIVKQGHLVGIVDFDDLAFGPPILDLASAFAEFAVDPNDDSIILDRASKLLDGYRSILGTISREDSEAFLPCIVYSYASWLACNAFHQVSYEESEIYDRRLALLRDKAAYRNWREAVASILG